MKPQIYDVKQLGKGRLCAMARPVSGEWIEEEFQGIAAAGIHQVVSLLQSQEAYSLGLKDEKTLCEKNQMQFVSFPISDRGLPSSLPAFSSLCRQLYQQIRQGRNTVVHCRAGIGRTGVVAAGILMQADYEPLVALKLISERRGVPVPDTEEQQDWLCRHQSQIRFQDWK